MSIHGLTAFGALLSLTACSVGHPLVGVVPSGEGGEDTDLSLLALGAIGGAALAAGGSAGTQLRFAYTGGSASVLRQFTVDDATGIFTANATPTVAGGSNMWDVEVHPNQGFVYAPDRSGGVVYQYAVDSTNGTLSPLTPATVVAGGADPLAMAIHPSGAHAYVSFVSGSGIDMYSIDSATGLLSAKAPANLAGCSSGNDMAFHPSGNFLYVVCGGGNQIRRHSVDGAGQLIHLGNTGGIGSQPSGLNITHDGAYLYATDQNSSQTFAFAIDQGSGALTPLGTPSIGTDTWPSKVAIDPSGQFAYVNCWNGGAQTVRMYRIGAGTGILSNNTPASISTGGGQPIDMRGDPTGRYVYVLNSAGNTTNMYSIDSTTGLLASNGLVSTPGSPRGIGFVTN